MMLASGVIVPQVTIWSDEVVPARAVLLTPGLDRLRYANPQDGDEFMDVLWTRELNNPGSGVPRWGEVHAGRQRQAMLEFRCQVCGEQLPPTNVPWLMPQLEWQNSFAKSGNRTNNPPTCENCWAVAEQRCPHLRAKGFLRLYAASVKPWGVLGDIYHPGLREHGLWISFGHEALKHVIARQLIVHLQGVVRAEDFARASTPESARAAAYRRQTGRKHLTPKQRRRAERKG